MDRGERGGEVSGRDPRRRGATSTTSSTSRSRTSRTVRGMPKLKARRLRASLVELGARLA